MFEVKIKTAGAAFEYPHEELARILRQIADQLEETYDSGQAYDYNGNTVGRWTLSQD